MPDTITSDEATRRLRAYDRMNGHLRRLSALAIGATALAQDIAEDGPCDAETDALHYLREMITDEVNNARETAYDLWGVISEQEPSAEVMMSAGIREMA